MIIKATNNFKKDILHYLSKDHDFNVLLIAYITHYDFDDNHEVYVEFENNRIIACLHRYYTRGHFYSHTKQYHYLEFSQLIDSLQLDRVLGNQKLNMICPYLYNKNIIVHFHYAVLDSLIRVNQDLPIRLAKEADIEAIFQLILKTQFLKTDYLKINKRKINKQAGKLYFLEHSNEVIASCETTETNDTALIGDVSTDINFRRQKIATKLVYQCCHDLLKEGKKPYLFYNDLNAGKIYHQLGFRDIGFYTMIRFIK